MNKTKQDNPYKFWDRVSGWSLAESAANSTLTKHLNNKFGVYILPGDTVLDYGCGTGTITLKIARNANKVYGIDVSEGMLKRAQQNLISQNIHNATFCKITALNKMFEDGTFDVITIFNVLQYIENRKELLTEFYKLLKPQGILIIAAPCFSGMNTFAALYMTFLRFVRIMPETYFFSTDRIEKEITDTGLTIIESTNLTNLPERFIIARKNM